MRRLLLPLAVLFLGLAGLARPQGSGGKVELSADERKILELTNAARKKESLAPLRPNAILMRAAREHSKNQLKQDTMAHELDGKTPFDRFKALGYAYGRAGENVAKSEGDVSVEEIFKGWMDSEGHRANILQKDFTEIGLGVASEGEGCKRKSYYTQTFGRPLRP